MKIAYFGHDLFSTVLHRLIADGHEIVRLFTFHADNRSNFNTDVLSVARSNRIPVVFRKPSPADIEAMTEETKPDLLLSAGYPHRIPCNGPVRGLNLHPTLLPEGRGRWPLPWLILRYPAAAGLTLHKLVRDWDAGDILRQVPVSLAETDDIATLTTRLRIAAPELVSAALADFAAAWDAAVPQRGGTLWLGPDAEQQILSGAKPVAENLRIMRAFGHFGAKIEIDGRHWNVTAATGWTEPHRHVPGTVVDRLGRQVTIAVADGYLVLTHLAAPDWTPHALQSAFGRLRERAPRVGLP
jgi:methionyl-tRNA formyltransferase